MSRRLLWLPFCLVLLGCGRDMHPKLLDEPCTRTDQCAAGLACLAGVCLPAPDPDPDAGVDGGTDAGS
ncbi:MAG: hypothetical protein JRG67_09230 [Deltaproteobacteria bacterium]|nr:hypothetical protein [Deltaproteobacteria bacterium]MBW1875076.1 hypothetical protein [Deltaproteobacteria bacterium]MBW2211214.1 hypothetical protein [Deltaproteobacteria bacterium]MBW2215410.1 hypothetical protein [Deltaproteobacteria bacterium]MBW2379961.1 hypothetical protein [Deltaproteobacteria bacterium]